MTKELLENLIKELTIVQVRLMQQRRDHNGNILQRDDIDQIQTTIEILLNLIMEPKHIWHKPNQRQ
jgi:hypothetical protein